MDKFFNTNRVGFELATGIIFSPQKYQKKTKEVLDYQ